ncbi:pentapeptide repeat-containing protein [Rothia sp. P7208]|uniref:pentapeptide repeat-containing protein n=1 Tax=Rothia sp. P7208 TaxID=3402660 RepID=UPI003ACC60D1
MVFSNRGGEGRNLWLGWVVVGVFAAIGIAVQLVLILCIKDQIINYIGKIIYHIVPLFTFIISIGIWVLIWATAEGNEQWRDVRQGILTVFAGLIGVIGAFATLAVNYENHEQNRNIITVKDLNERLHEILKNRHNSEDNNARASSYFQLAGLYKDWGLLGENSEIIKKQRNTQQKYILKLIFGTVPQKEQEQKKSTRSLLEITTLNSVIADIFPRVSDTDEHKKSFESFDLQYADLSGLTFDGVFFPKYSNLSHADLTRANLQNAYLQNAYLQHAYLQHAKLQEADLWGANLQNADLQNAYLQHAYLQHAKLQHANLQTANLWGANLQTANLWGANLQNAKLLETNLQNANLQNANLQNANLRYADLQHAILQNAHLYGRAEQLTSKRLAQARSVESIEIRECDWHTNKYGKEDHALKNLIQEALKIQEEQKNNPPQNS